MTPLGIRFTRLARSPRVTLGIFTVLVIGTAAAVLSPHLARGGGQSAPQPPPANPPIAVVQQDTQGVQLTGALAQSKLVQGSNGVVYLDLTITAPTLAGTGVPRRASDIIVVLDRSGSMAADNKLPYAKEAVRTLVGRLQAEDRFALIVFDSQAAVQIPLSPVTESVRTQILRQVQGIRPGASTNIGDGLLTARALLEGGGSTRSRRVILLSDGETNVGIVDPKELGKIAASLSQHQAVLSTIGMGLEFNETLMASLADYGMGHYAYLERLATLGEILQQDVSDAQQVYANASRLELTLGEGVTITDAGGYPLDTTQPGTARVVTGQLLGGTKKHFVVTLQVPTTQVGDVRLGTATLHYTTGAGPTSLALPAEGLQVAVLETSRREEAAASMDMALQRQIWETNNLGRTQKELSTWLRRGDKQKAEAAITQYRDALKAAEATAGAPMSSPESLQKLSDMEKDLNDAFTGPAGEQATKRNRAAKEQHKKSFQGQRTY
jgi:Ca-activated chloride channel family protein